MAGPNHVLPTAGTARYASALGVDHFMKRTSLIQYSEEAFRREAKDIIRRYRESLGEGDRYTKQEREQYQLEADKVLQDAAFWRKIGEEFQSPLIITGRIDFEEQNRSGFCVATRNALIPPLLMPAT